MAELGLELRGSNIVDQLVEKQLDLEKREAALKSKVEEWSLSSPAGRGRSRFDSSHRGGRSRDARKIGNNG